jgi:hypothetical protein
VHGLLYTINLASGAANLIGAIGGTDQIRDIAIAPAKSVAAVGIEAIAHQ